MGTLKRVPLITYSLLGVVNGELWLPAQFGISMMLFVRKVPRSTRAIRGVLFPLMKHHLPSGTPSVMESSGWWLSSHGMNPWVVISMGLVSSEKPQPLSGFTLNTGMFRSMRPLGMP